MTADIIDRLPHKSYILNMNGNSYRLKETKEYLPNKTNYCKGRRKIWSIFIDFFRKSGVILGCNMVYFSFAICI